MFLSNKRGRKATNLRHCECAGERGDIVTRLQESVSVARIRSGGFHAIQTKNPGREKQLPRVHEISAGRSICQSELEHQSI